MPGVDPARKRLYPTTKDGQPLLTNWTENRKLDEWSPPAPEQKRGA